MKRPFRNSNGRGRGRTMNRNRFQNRSQSHTRNKAYLGLDRCFNCNMVGHFARNCFTRTRTQSQNRANFPRRFTANFRKNQRRGNQRNQQPRVRFQDQNINRYAQNRYQNDFEYGQRVINNNRYLNRLDPTGQYTDTYPEEYEQNANQGHEYQDEYQNQYQNQYQDQYNGYPLN